MQHGLGLQDADESAAEIEDQSAFRVGLLGDADGGALFGGLEAQIALVPALEKLTDARRDEGAGQGRPHAVAGRDLSTVR